VNIFLGNNGEGKTNLLEAISYLCLSRSFYAMSDAIVVKLGEEKFRLAGKINLENGSEREVKLEYDQTVNKKHIEVNREKIDRSSLLVGQFPIVILSPEQNSITIGSPVNRRQWIDFIVSQSSRVYLESLIDYRKVLKQRNKILSDFQAADRKIREEIEPWNGNLVSIGADIIRKRADFLNDIQGIIRSLYAQLAGTKEEPGLTYRPSFVYSGSDKGSIEGSFFRSLEEQFAYERRIGYSLVGPHRDEIVFELNGLSMQKFASQGQHKTYLIVLKLAEFFYLKDKCSETPVLLLDDVLSELDKERSQKLLETASGYGQTFITSTSEHELNWIPVASANPRRFMIRKGEIESVEDAVSVR
jgi:DNA replication and repair protein RecF